LSLTRAVITQRKLKQTRKHNFNRQFILLSLAEVVFGATVCLSVCL